MCRVVVVSETRFPSEKKKKSFEFAEKEKIIQQRKIKPGDIIEFKYPINKKEKRSLRNYMSRYPDAIVWKN